MAFTLNNGLAAAFEQNEVAVHVASHSCHHLGITHEELLNLVDKAASQYWNRVPTSRLRLKKGRVLEVDSRFSTALICLERNPHCKVNTDLKVEREILIACNGNLANFDSSFKVYGATVPNHIMENKIRGALILLNHHPDTSFVDLKIEQQVAVIAHELGHAIGLGHSQFDRNLMYADIIPQRTALGPDDVDGITWLYPTGQPFAGCASLGKDKEDRIGRPPKLLIEVLGLFLGIFLGIKSLAFFLILLNLVKVSPFRGREGF